jgi:hypothetical protein
MAVILMMAVKWTTAVLEMDAKTTKVKKLRRASGPIKGARIIFVPIVPAHHQVPDALSTILLLGRPALTQTAARALILHHVGIT